MSWVADTFYTMSTTTLVGGEPLDILIYLFHFPRVRRKPSGWYDASRLFRRISEEIYRVYAI